MTKSMKDSCINWIGMIPEDWKIIRNKNILFKTKNVVGSESKNYDVLSLTMKGVIKRNLEFNVGKIPESFDGYQIVMPNSLLICLFDIDVTPRCVGIVNDLGITTSAYNNFSFNDKIKCNPKYYYYWYLMLDYDKKLLHLSKNIRSSITTTEFLALPVPYPDFENQNKIAHFLDRKCEELNKIIEKNKNAIVLMEEYQNVLISETVSRGIKKFDFKKVSFDWIEKIPVNWMAKKIRFLGSFKSGLSNKKPEDFGHGTPFLTYKDVYKNCSFYATSELVNATSKDIHNCNIKRGDVFFTGSSETIEELGFSSVCLKDIENGTYNGFCIRFRPYNDKEIMPEFSKYYFRSRIVREFLVRSDNSVTRTNLSQSKLKNVMVLLPPKIEQEEIVKYLDDKCSKIDKIIEYRKSIIEKLEEYKESLIYEAVTGKIEV